MTKTIEVSFTANVPAEATEDQLIEWLRFQLCGSACSNDNPMSDREIEAEFSSIQID